MNYFKFNIVFKKILLFVGNKCSKLNIVKIEPFVISLDTARVSDSSLHI